MTKPKTLSDVRFVPDHFELLDAVTPDLDEARAKLESTRDRLLALADEHDRDAARLRDLARRLDGMVRELRRAEEVVSESGAPG